MLVEINRRKKIVALEIRLFLDRALWVPIIITSFLLSISFLFFIQSGTG